MSGLRAEQSVSSGPLRFTIAHSLWSARERQLGRGRDDRRGVGQDARLILDVDAWVDRCPAATTSSSASRSCNHPWVAARLLLALVRGTGGAMKKLAFFAVSDPHCSGTESPAKMAFTGQ
jgi:hypothetical protein